MGQCWSRSAAQRTYVSNGSPSVHKTRNGAFEDDTNTFSTNDNNEGSSNSSSTSSASSSSSPSTTPTNTSPGDHIRRPLSMQTNDRLLASYYVADMLSMNSNNETNDDDDTINNSHLFSNDNSTHKSSDLRTLRRAIIKFNTNPKTGIELLHKSNLLHHSPNDIAYFLFTHGILPNGAKIANERLSPIRIGEYLGQLGGKDEDSRKFHRSMLDAYVRLFNFHGLSLVSALRQFLTAFRLPGEAQVIDRIMARFGEVFVRDNPEVLRNADAAYVLSFAAIMLNTDLHRSSIRNKMTRQQFTKNMAGIDGGSNVDPLLLQNIYDDIAQRPLASEIECDVVTFFSPAKQGWLLKRCTGTVPRWKKRYFVLADGVLYYFLSPNDVATGVPRCIVPLEHAGVEGTGMTGIRIFPLTDNGIRNTVTPNGKLVLQSPPSSSSGANNNSSTGKNGKAKFLVSAKRTDTGVMRKGAYEQFIVRVETPNDRQTWLSALSAHSSGGHMNRIRRLSVIKMATSAMVATVTANAALQSPIHMPNGKSNGPLTNGTETVLSMDPTVSTATATTHTQADTGSHHHSEPSFSQSSHDKDDESFLIKGKDTSNEELVPVYLEMDKENNLPLTATTTVITAVPKLFASPSHTNPDKDETMGLRTPSLGSSQTPITPRTPLTVPPSDIFSLTNENSIRSGNSFKGTNAFAPTSSSVPDSPAASVVSNHSSHNGGSTVPNSHSTASSTGLPLLPPPPQRGISASSITIKALPPPPRTPILPPAHSVSLSNASSLSATETNSNPNNTYPGKMHDRPGIAHEHLLQLAAAAAAVVSYDDDNDDTSALLDTASELSSVDDDDTIGNGGGSHSAWSEDAEFLDDDLTFGTGSSSHPNASSLPPAKELDHEFTDNDHTDDSDDSEDNDPVKHKFGLPYPGNSSKSTNPSSSTNIPNNSAGSRTNRIQGQLSKLSHPVKQNSTVYSTNTITSGIAPSTTVQPPSSLFRSSPIKERTKLAGDSHAFASAFNRNKMNTVILQNSPQRSTIQNRPIFGNDNDQQQQHHGQLDTNSRIEHDDTTMDNDHPHKYIQDSNTIPIEGTSTRLRNNFNTGLSNTLRLLGGHTTAAMGGFERTLSNDTNVTIADKGSSSTQPQTVGTVDINGVLASLPPLPPAAQKHDIKKVLDIMTGSNSRHPPNQARTRTTNTSTFGNGDTGNSTTADQQEHSFPSIDSDTITRPREGSNSVLLQ